jgi:hypothetical protein
LQLLSLQTHKLLDLFEYFTVLMCQIKYVLDVQLSNDSTPMLLLCLHIFKTFIFLAAKHRHAVETRLHDANSR